MVAINTDRNAPIAKMADLVLVGDMQQIIPELTKQLRELMKPTT
jgi:electron transfer flavoprotein alpha subunit